MGRNRKVRVPALKLRHGKVDPLAPPHRMPIGHNKLKLAFRPRAALLLWSAALLAAIIAAPLAASSGRPEGWFLYQAFAPFCHQQPRRSWQLQGYPLAVCARCVGVYGGLLLAALLGLQLPTKAVGMASWRCSAHPGLWNSAVWWLLPQKSGALQGCAGMQCGGGGRGVDVSAAARPTGECSGVSQPGPNRIDHPR